MDTKIAEKIINNLKNIVDNKFSEVNKQALEQIEDFNKNNQDIQYEYGVSYILSEQYVSYDVISFVLTTSGSLGGTSWENIEYYNYSYKTGELLKLEDVCIETSTCKEIMINYFLEELKKDERVNSLNDGYESVVKEELLKNNNWGYDKEGLHLLISKYVIASGAEGIFDYTFSKEVVNNYLKEEYKIK